MDEQEAVMIGEKIEAMTTAINRAAAAAEIIASALCGPLAVSAELNADSGEALAVKVHGVVNTDRLS
jgi:hypothetical protein